MNTQATASQAVIEEVGPSRKKITITIPGDAVAEQIESALESIMVDAQLPGFRAGKAPRAVVEKRFGAAIRDEAKQQLVSAAYQQAVKDNELAVLGEPIGGDELADAVVEPGTPIVFSLEVEVPPEFDLPDYDAIEINKPLVEIDDSHVDKQIKKICETEGDLEHQDKAKPGDYCIGKGVMIADGEQVLDIDGAVIQIPAKDSDGKGAILGIQIDDFAKKVGLPKPNDKLEFKATGPEHHEDDRVRGKALEISLDIERVETIVPATVESLIEKFGLQDEAQLREVLTLRLNQRALLEQQNAMRQQAANYLLDNVEMTLPERLTEDQTARNLQRRRMELMYRGFDQDKIEENIAELRTSSNELAQRELKLFFILGQISNKLDVQLTEDEINGRIVQMAQDRGVSPTQLRDQLIKQNQINSIAQQVREHKTLDAILASAKINEIPVEEYNASVNAERGTDKVDVSG